MESDRISFQYHVGVAMVQVHSDRVVDSTGTKPVWDGAVVLGKVF